VIPAFDRACDESARNRKGFAPTGARGEDEGVFYPMTSTPEQRDQQRQANFGLPGGPVMTPERRVEHAHRLQAAGRGTKSTVLRGGKKT
jgi:hypothetical protein